MKRIVIAAVTMLLVVKAMAQVREIPKIVEETFANQYPSAEDVDFKDQLLKVEVHFTWKGEKMMATYTNKGLWKGTEKDWDFEKLAEEVKDGFEKSKFADWEVSETAVLYLPGGSEQYRLRVRKNDVQKKYLFFNKFGRLLREAITL